MADRRRTLRRLGLTGLGFAAVAVSGFLLAGCGGGDGSAVTTRTGVTGTRPTATATRPPVAAPTRTVPTVPTPTVTTLVTTTDETRTSETPPAAPPPAPPPSPPPPPPPPTTVTVIETETTAPTTPTTTTAEPTPMVASEPSSTSSTHWIWFILAVALATATAVALLVWRHRRVRAASWSTQLADLSRRTLVTLDAVLADGSVVTGQVQALADEARSLERQAPDDQSRAAAGRLRGALEELAVTLEADRALRLSSPPPSTEQLSYSTALIHQQVEQVQRELRPPAVGPPQ
jgi:hypothetical protein